MAIRRIMRLKLLCVIACALIGYYIIGRSTQPHEVRNQNFEAGHDFDFYMAGLHASQGSNLDKRSQGTKRRNVAIVSHGRSGSSLMGDIFNHHPSVFYMYEPLQTPQRVWRRKSDENVSYSGLVKQFLTGVFRCDFNQPEMLADIERYYRKPSHPRISQAIASPPLCPYNLTDPRWDPKFCHPMTKESLGNVCKDNYDLTVIKVLFSRIPENGIETILNTCKPLDDVDCKVVFLVRDPRAVIPSSHVIGFFKENGEANSKESLRIYSYLQCKKLEDNLEFIRKLPDSLRHRIKLQRYEDLARNPLKELSGLYEFAGLNVLESVRAWLNETTHLSRKDCTELDGVTVTCTKDDAWQAANRWRWKVNPHEIDIIEYYCESVMRLLGYRPVDRSYELLARNVTTPLFYDEYEAKQWFFY